MADLRVTTSNDFDYIISTSTNNPIRTSGFQSLVQIVVKTLLTAPGRDVFNPKYGGGLIAILSSTTDASKPASLRADVGFSISKTLSDIHTEQDSSLDSLLPEERLRNLTLEGLEFNRDDLVWCVRIGVESEGGDNATIGLRN